MYQYSNMAPGLLSRTIMGAFNSTKYSENFEMGTNGTPISHKSFQKIQKLLLSELFNLKFWKKGKWKEHFSIPCKFILFSGHSAKCSSIHFWKFLKLQLGVFFLSNGKRPVVGWSFLRIQVFFEN